MQLTKIHKVPLNPNYMVNTYMPYIHTNDTYLFTKSVGGMGGGCHRYPANIIDLSQAYRVCMAKKGVGVGAAALHSSVTYLLTYLHTFSSYGVYVFY